jgi:hypothetical protein
MIIKCDFCACALDESAAYVVHGEPMEVTAVNADTGEVLGGWDSPDDWAACNVCHDRLLHRDYDAIIAGVVAGQDDDFIRELAPVLYQMYSSLSVLQ